MSKLNNVDYQISIKQGVVANINTTATKNSAVTGEPHYATDTEDLYIYNGTENKLVAIKDHTLLSNIGTNTHAQIDTFIETTVPSTYLPLASISTAQATDLTDGGETTLHSHASSTPPPDRTKLISYRTDFMNGGTQDSYWSLANLGGGSSTATDGEVAHPGITRYLKNTTNPGGASIRPNTLSIFLYGGEETNLIERFLTTGNLIQNFGWIDNITGADPAMVDGAWIKIAGTTLTGRTSKASSMSTTGTSYTITTNTWYRLRIVINSALTRVDYYVYNESGTELWTDNLTTNIPNTSSNGVWHQCFTLINNASALNIADYDYMDLFNLTGTLTR